MLVFLFSALIFIGNGTIEIPVVNTKIKAFKNRGEFIETINLNDCTVDLYKVNATNDYELDNYKKVLDKDILLNNHLIGSELDIILTNRNPLEGYAGAIVRDFVDVFSRNFFLGHANVVVKDGSKVIHANRDGVNENNNTWIDDMITKSETSSYLIGLRIKDLDDEKIKTCKEFLYSKVGCKYNYNFLITKKNSFYCLDLITEMAKKIDIRLNYDSLISTGNDMLVSEKAFIIFILERTDKDKLNLYYLDKE